MSRGPLFDPEYRPQFSGHETFPLRYGWLKKAFDAVHAAGGESENKSVFLRDDAIARFGVGKNMVGSMRHWANMSGILEEQARPNLVRTTSFGQLIFGETGLDPFMEHPATLWLIHWHLAGRPEKATWYWAFNHFSGVTFERETFAKALQKLAATQGWSRVAAATVKRDVDCFVRTYAARPPANGAAYEDNLESPLTELGLIRSIGRRDGFRFVRGPKPSLGDGVFIYALVDFWQRLTSARTLSLEAIVHEAGSPGRVFLLDEEDVADRLIAVEEVTRGILRWSETAGLKQVQRRAEIELTEALQFIQLDYDADGVRGLA